MEKNYLDELFPLDNKKAHYILRFYDPQQPIAEVNEDAPVTWRRLLDYAIHWCRTENICLSYLGEQALFQEGYQGRAWMLPDEAAEYIAEAIKLGAGVLEYASHSEPTLGSSGGFELVAEERLEQIEKHKFDEERDAQYVNGELVAMAQCYAATEYDDENGLVISDEHKPDGWPFDDLRYWRPKNKVADLAKAGALYMAEQDRLNAPSGSWTVGALQLRPIIQGIIKQINALVKPVVLQ